MTSRKKFKERVRSRMQKTGESYSIAKKHVEQRASQKPQIETMALSSGRRNMSTNDMMLQYNDVAARTGYPADALVAAVQTVDEAVKCVAIELLPSYLERPDIHSGSESRLVQDWIDELLPKEYFTLNDSNKKAYRLNDGKLLKFVGNRGSTFAPRLNPTAECCPMLAYDFCVRTPSPGVTQVWLAMPKSMSRALTQARRGPGTNLARVTFEWVHGLPVIKAAKIALLKHQNAHG